MENFKPMLRKQHGAAGVGKAGKSCAAAAWVSEKAFRAKGPARHRERGVRRTDLADSVMETCVLGWCLGERMRLNMEGGLPPDLGGLLSHYHEIKVVGESPCQL